MPVVKYAPVRFPACDLKICYQLNLLLGFFVSCFLILSPALYFYLLQEPLTVIELLPGRTSTASDDGITSQVELSVIPSPPGLAGGSHRRPTGNRSGIFPVIGPDIDQYFDDSGYQQYYGPDDSLPLNVGDYPGNGVGSGTVSSPDTAVYSFNAPIERRPELIWMKGPEYPELARRAGTEGKVILHVLVDEQGRVVEVKIFSEMPENLGFGEKAVLAVKGARFQPALNDHYPVRCWVILPVEFELD